MPDEVSRQKIQEKESNDFIERYRDYIHLDYLEWEKQYEELKNHKVPILPHKFYADFVVYEKIILKVKAVGGIADEFVAQAINYLKVSNNKLVLIVNFGELKLNYKRVVL